MARRSASILMAAGLVMALTSGCGSDDDASTETTEVEDGTTTTQAPTSSTTEGATTTTSGGGGELPDEPPLDEDGLSGSGCSPGADDLTDGWWYGTFEGDVGATVSFDLACYYVGAAAEAEAASRGDEVNNDYYVVNDNPALRTVPVADDATASCVELDSTLEMVDCAPDETDPMWAKWIRVQGGEIDRIVEQYAP